MERKLAVGWKVAVALGMALVLGVGLALVSSGTRAQEPKPLLEIPMFEGAQVEWEVLLTDQDFLGHLKNWIKEKLLPMPEMPSSLDPSANQWLQWWFWGSVGGDLFYRILADLSEIKAIGYKVQGEKTAEVLAFYEKELAQWSRNFWVKPSEYGSVRLFTQGDVWGLQNVAVIAVWKSYDYGESTDVTETIVLRARR